MSTFQRRERTGVATLSDDHDLPFTGEDGKLVYKATVTLPGYGHKTLQTADPGTGGWSQVAGKKGVMFVHVTSGDNISLLGLRFNPAGTFTSMHTVYTYAYPQTQ